ncbi:Cyanate MFS transporter [Actinomycetales bacterium JB111]|nr:Cyanate MFS transporter [Actinomycetales bacterium JB111]
MTPAAPDDGARPPAVRSPLHAPGTGAGKTPPRQTRSGKSRPRRTRPGKPRSHLVSALVGILLAASTLRALVTPVGPLLSTLEAETGAGPEALGVLTALPVLGFAVVSPFVHAISTRLGVERTVVLGLAVIVAGSLLRTSSSSAVLLLAGTAVLAAGIAVGNVLVPVLTKRFFPDHAPGVTGAYMAVQTVVAALAAGLVVPLHERTGSWQVALGVWVAPAIVALVVWLPRIRGERRRGGPDPAVATAGRAPDDEPAGGPADDVATHHPGDAPSPWRSAVGWQVATYFLLQACVFYLTITWVPSVSVDLGFSETQAGWQIFWLMMFSLVATFGTPRLMQVGGDQRFVAVLLPVLVPLPLVGLVVLPGAELLWVALLGTSCGGSMVLSLSLISLRTGGSVAAGRLSAMAQSVAYSGVVLTLLAASALRDLTAPGPQVLWLIGAMAAAQLLVGLVVGRDRRIAAGPTSAD